MVLPALLTAALAVAAIVYVARPFLRVEAGPVTLRRDARASEWLLLVEERDRALAALKELEFDHRTGKISDCDYRELVGPLRHQADEALRSLEPADAGAGSSAERSRRSSVGKVRA
jgi:hypothetical protein